MSCTPAILGGVGDIIPLEAVPGREVCASCGCAFVEVATRDLIDEQFVVGRAMVVVPCWREGHKELGQRVLSDRPDTLEEAVGSMEGMLRGD